ncbi:TolC family protein [Fibrella sp. HMF5036]|uniref:TolC family protein n=2 Tax=Fibrella aquatilis TaxID=2817059 RepID=A0A939K1X9_9BACT|nr:TolC family protein [Fibrella aquatilis]
MALFHRLSQNGGHGQSKRVTLTPQLRMTTYQMPFKQTLLAIGLTFSIGILPLTGSVCLAQTPASITPGSSATVAATPGAATNTQANAVQVLGLQQCIDIALKNNITIQQGQLQVESSELQLRQSRFNQLPSVNAFISQNVNSGYNVDPVTYQFVNRTIGTNSLQLNATMPIFQGYQLKNTIRQNKLIRQATEKELAATQNNVALNVIQQYLNVLTGAEQLAIAKRQVETSLAQVDRTQKLVNAGSAPEANLYEIRATLANDQLVVVNNQNTVDLAKLALLQAMNLPAGQPFEVEFINLPDPRIEAYELPASEVYNVAKQTQPQLLGADLRVEAARRSIEVARAGLYPRLSLSGSVNTIYSSNGNPKITRTNTIVTTEIGTINVGNASVPVSTTSTGFVSSDYTFLEQLNNNLSQGISLNLNIPIFGQRLARTNITNATIQQRNAQLNADNTRLQLRQQIETAYTSLLAASNRYQATEASVISLERAFRAAESRYNAGAINATDYNIAKNRYDIARGQLVQAKYDYVFRVKILDFYQNKPLTFN